MERSELATIDMNCRFDGFIELYDVCCMDLLAIECQGLPEAIEPRLYLKKGVHTDAAMVGLAAGIRACGIGLANTGLVVDRELANLGGHDWEHRNQIIVASNENHTQTTATAQAVCKESNRRKGSIVALGNGGMEGYRGVTGVEKLRTFHSCQPLSQRCLRAADSYHMGHHELSNDFVDVATTSVAPGM